MTRLLHSHIEDGEETLERRGSEESEVDQLGGRVSYRKPVAIAVGVCLALLLAAAITVNQQTSAVEQSDLEDHVIQRYHTRKTTKDWCCAGTGLQWIQFWAAGKYYTLHQNEGKYGVSRILVWPRKVDAVHWKCSGTDVWHVSRLRPKWRYWRIGYMNRKKGPIAGYAGRMEFQSGPMSTLSGADQTVNLR